MAVKQLTGLNEARRSFSCHSFHAPHRCLVGKSDSAAANAPISHYSLPSEAIKYTVLQTCPSKSAFTLLLCNKKCHREKKNQYTNIHFGNVKY